MDSDKKSNAIEEDAEKSQLNIKARRSSILKPQKPRNPFTTLDFSEPNPDNTLAKAARRVSFASSNLIKPFAADPEKNTIWDTTYEEEINHTDSTKSSYEQIHETKSNDFLNITSIYCPESDSFEVSVPKVLESDITNLVAVEETLKPYLKQTVKNSVSLRNREIVLLEAEADTSKMMNMKLIDKENVYIPDGRIMSSSSTALKKQPDDMFKSVSSTMPFNEIITQSFGKKMCTKDNIKTTNVINKENLNPIINDIILATPLETCIKRNTTLRSNKAEIMTIAESQVAGRDNSFTNRNHTVINQSDMELTKTLLVTEIRENVTDPIADTDKENKTVYFTEDMDLTTKLDGKSETIYFGKSNSTDVKCNSLKDMNFTCASTKSILEDDKMEISRNISLTSSICKQDSKKEDSFGRKTIYMDQSNNDMKFTSNLPSNIVEELNNLKSNCTQNSPNSMELTMQANVKNNIDDIVPTLVEKRIGGRQESSFNLQDSNMELTSTLPCLNLMPTITPLNNQLKNETIFEDNMDITMASPVKIESLYEMSMIPNKSTRKTINFNQSMDITRLSNTGVIKETEVISKNEMNFGEISNTISALPFETNIELTNILPVKEQVSVPEISFMRTPDKTVGIESRPILNVTKSTMDNGRLISVLESHGTRNNTVSSTNQPDKQESIVDNVNIANEFSKQDKNISLVVTDQKLKENTVATAIGTHCKNTPRELPQINVENRTPLLKEAANITGVKRLSDNKDDSELAIKRKSSLTSHTTPIEIIDKDTEIDKSDLSTEPFENKVYNNNKLTLHDKVSAIAENFIDADNTHSHNKGKNEHIPPHSTSLSNNILYSEPMKIKLKTHNIAPIADLSDNLNLQSLNGSLNLKLEPTSTPATSFHMTLTDMSPCIEDTQQLIYATFSKPECTQNKDLLLLSDKKKYNSHTETVGDLQSLVSENLKNSDQTYVCKKSNNSESNDFEVQEKTFVNENVEIFMNQFDTEQNCYIQDESQVDLDEDVCLDNSPGKTENIEINDTDSKTNVESVINNSNRISDFNNYTLRSQLVLSNIKKHTEHYEIIRNEDHDKLLVWAKEAKRNCAQIKELINNFKTCNVQIIDLEEKHKQDREESSRMSEIVSNSDDDKGIPSTAGLVAPKSLYDRVCEAAERCKKYWKLEKLENDEYYFFTLFGSLPFKVHVHPEFGIVYGVKTYTHLEANARPICWYDLKLCQQKLQEKNLLLVLGEKFDILTLLDYVYMMMEEIISFHIEYIELVKRCGVSHHFRMNPDLSVSFEVINIELIIHWIITINMWPTAICKESVKAISKVGENVKEEDIQCIVENTPKGPRFLSNFIENVNEYVKRISKRIRMRRHR